MKTGVLSSGFRYEIQEDCFDDMEILENIEKIEKGEVWKVGSILLKILGEEKKKELYETLRNENGRVSVESASKALEEIISSDDTGKNF